MKKKLLCLMVACVLSVGSLTACGGGSSTNTTTEESKDMLGTYMTAVQDMVEQKGVSAEYSYNSNDWTYLEDGEIVTVTTDVTTSSSSEKQVLTAIFTFKDNAYKGHYLKIGGDVLLDDGTIE